MEAFRQLIIFLAIEFKTLRFRRQTDCLHTRHKRLNTLLAKKSSLPVSTAKATKRYYKKMFSESSEILPLSTLPFSRFRQVADRQEKNTIKTRRSNMLGRKRNQ